MTYYIYFLNNTPEVWVFYYYTHKYICIVISMWPIYIYIHISFIHIAPNRNRCSYWNTHIKLLQHKAEYSYLCTALLPLVRLWSFKPDIHNSWPTRNWTRTRKATSACNVARAFRAANNTNKQLKRYLSRALAKVAPNEYDLLLKTLYSRLSHYDFNFYLTL